MHSIHRLLIQPDQSSTGGSRKTKVFRALIWSGMICWAIVCGRHVSQLVTNGRSIPVKSVAAKTSMAKTVRSLIADSPSLDDDLSADQTAVEDVNSLSPEFSADTRGLELQSTLINRSRRMAVISGSQVAEGTTTTICGITLHVDSIAPRHVGLSIDGTPVRLPLVFGVELAGDVNTTFPAASELFSRATDGSSGKATTDIR